MWIPLSRSACSISNFVSITGAPPVASFVKPCQLSLSKLLLNAYRANRSALSKRLSTLIHIVSGCRTLRQPRSDLTIVNGSMWCLYCIRPSLLRLNGPGQTFARTEPHRSPRWFRYVQHGCTCKSRYHQDWLGCYCEQSFATIQRVFQLRLLIACQTIDLHHHIDGLSALSKQKFAKDPFSGALIVFRNYLGMALKLL